MLTAQKRSWLICLALIGLIAAVYWPVRHFEFLLYDDTIYVSLNEHVHRGLSWSQVAWAFTTRECNMWHPLTWLSHLLDWQLFGNDAGKHHIAPVLFHIGSSIALFFAWKRMTGKPWVSAFAATVFALHPLRVESVAWVAERKDVTTGFFSMLTLLAYAHYATTPATDRSRRWRMYGLTIVAFICGLMCKPMQVTWPAALLLLDFWPLKRFTISDLRFTSAFRKVLLEKVPLIVLAIAAVPVTIWAAREGAGSMTGLDKVPFDARVANAFVAHLHYLKSFVWPTDLAAQYPHPIHWPTSTVMLAVSVFLALTVFSLVMYKRQPWWLVAWFWMLATSLPVIGLVQLGAHAFADRYTYIPMVVMPLAVAMTASVLFKAIKLPNAVVAVAGTAVVIALAVSARTYLWTWQNTKTLFERSLAVTERNAFAHNNLAAYLSEHGDPDGAIYHAQKALEIVPTYPDPHDSLAFGLTQKGRDVEAIPEYQKALSYEGMHGQESLSLLHNGYGTSLARTGHVAEASEEFRKCVEMNPTLPEGHCNFGMSLNTLGRKAEAAAQFREALRLRPNYDTAQTMLQKLAGN
ncbi:MAG: tetratricopeptide repeat protein [Limisphaerales bacterium]